MQRIKRIDAGYFLLAPTTFLVPVYHSLFVDDLWNTFWWICKIRWILIWRLKRKNDWLSESKRHIQPYLYVFLSFLWDLFSIKRKMEFLSNIYNGDFLHCIFFFFGKLKLFFEFYYLRLRQSGKGVRIKYLDNDFIFW